MKYDAEKREVICKKELNNLDRFVLDFVDILKDYVIVSGYVSILFGRSRATEDVDLLIPKMDRNEFGGLWKDLIAKGFECVNTSDMEEAFDFLGEHAIRFFRKTPVPNIEFKLIKTDLDKYSYENKIKVVLNEKFIFVSPLEMQIAYKLFLAADGTDEKLRPDKDIEDARHLYKVFEDKLNKEELLAFVKKLNVGKRLRLLK